MRFRIGAFLIVAVAMLFAMLRYAPPRALGSDAPAEQFSAERARAVLVRLLGDGRPHPVASEANVAVRKRLLVELQRLGLEPELQSGFSCGGFGACADVVNVLAWLPGREAGPGVLIASHYDSVGAGPGASDDGAGVAAALEISRALRARPARRKVLLLFTDGEEAGLLGARLFVRDRAALEQVRAAVNLEARGTTGPSVMFETSAGNAELVTSFAKAVSRPVTGSLFHAVYRSLPNDTDFTVFSSAGLAGENLAFIGGVARYHTPLDDIAHLDLGSLQHQGETALAAARALADDPPAGPAASDAVFFDVFALFVLRWKKPWTLALTALVTVLVAGALARLFARRELAIGSLAKSAGVIAGVIASAMLLGLGLETAWRTSGALPSPWIASPTPAHTATALAGIMPIVALPALLYELDETALFAASVLGFTLLAWMMAIFLPEASQLALIPTFAAGAFALVATRAGALAFLAASLLVLLPLTRLLYDAIGFNSVAATAALWALMFVPLLTVCARPALRRAPSLALLTALFVTASIAALLRPFSTDLPQRVTIAHHEDADTRRARWLIDMPWGRLPEPLQSGHDWHTASAPRILPWAWSAELLESPAEPLGLAGPAVEVLSRDGDHVTLRVLPRRGAYGTFFLAPASAALGSFVVEGQPVTFRWTGTHRAYTILGKADGFEAKLVVRSKFRLVVADFTLGLPSTAAGLRSARSAKAVSSQAGDVTVVSRTLAL